MTARTEMTWRDTILFMPNIRTYMKYKSLFGTEEYVKCLMSHKQRCILSQFRSGTLPLKIVTERWQNLPVPERVCLCAEDNEFHFLCICKKYKDIRESLYNKTVSRNVPFASLSNEDKVMYIMKFENVEVAKFLIRAYEIRKVNCTVLRYYVVDSIHLHVCTNAACNTVHNVYIHVLSVKISINVTCKPWVPISAYIFLYCIKWNMSLK